MKKLAGSNCLSENNCSISSDASLYILEGRSMLPAFRAGDLLLMKKVPVASLKQGNVIAFDSPGHQKTVIHRIIGFRDTDRERLLLTRGDNSGPADEPIRQQSVKGRISGRLSNGHFQPSRRYRELYWLYASRWHRSFRRFVRYLAVQITQIIFPVLAIRVRTQQRDLRILKTGLVDRFRT